MYTNQDSQSHDNEHWNLQNYWHLLHKCLDEFTDTLSYMLQGLSYKVGESYCQGLEK